MEVISIEENGSVTFTCNFYDAAPYGDFLDEATFDLVLYYANGDYSIVKVTIDS